MTFEEIKEAYKGISIKPVDENTGNSKGYFAGNNTVYIFKSELINKAKNTKNGFIINGELYILPQPLKTKLQMHFAKEISEPPAGIDFDSKTERYRVPVSYLQQLTNNNPEVKEEINSNFVRTDLPQEPLQVILPTEPINLGQNSYYNPITNVSPQGILTTSTQCYSVNLLNKLAAYLEK